MEQPIVATCGHPGAPAPCGPQKGLQGGFFSRKAQGSTESVTLSTPVFPKEQSPGRVMGHCCPTRLATGKGGEWGAVSPATLEGCPHCRHRASLHLGETGLAIPHSTCSAPRTVYYGQRFPCPDSLNKPSPAVADRAPETQPPWIARLHSTPVFICMGQGRRAQLPSASHYFHLGAIPGRQAAARRTLDSTCQGQTQLRGGQAR